MYKFEAYDVCQVSYDCGKTWMDYATIRTVNDAQCAMTLVRTGGMVALNGVQTATEFRIIRGGREEIVFSKKDIDENAKRLARNAKARANRGARKDASDSIGVKEVRGAMGGKYIE